ncbi:hypothetical protein [Lacibacter sp. H407]|uniref:hypothetical protein n=1 Tax=Lacibacter sp. H407 TaxID=3133423 RepID=UPI0030BF2AC5
MRRFVYLLILFTSYDSYAQENVNEKNIDSIVNYINKQKLQISKTITSDSTEDKDFFIDIYYSDSNGNLVLFTSKFSGKIKFGKLTLFSESNFFFHENSLIKLEIKRNIQTYNPSINELYFYRDSKYTKKEKRFRSDIAKKEKKILETFEK